MDGAVSVNCGKVRPVLLKKSLKKVLTMGLWLLIIENVKGYTSINIK